MRVILRENIENLGKKGDIVKVAPGYGRNFLIPKKMAIEVTPNNAKMIAIEQAALQKGFEEERSAYTELIQRLNQVSLSFSRKTSEKDVIFGSVSSTDIRDALEDLGFDIEIKKVVLDEPIKRLGHYTVPLKIFHEERAEIKIEVVKEGAPLEKSETVDRAEPEKEADILTPKERETADAPAGKDVEAVPEQTDDKEAVLERKPEESQEMEQEARNTEDRDTERTEEAAGDGPSDEKEDENKEKGE